MKTELRIDGAACDLGSATLAVPGYAARKTRDLDACREGRKMTVTIPPTPRNTRLLGAPRDPHTGERFNAAAHTAEVAAEGTVLLAGTVRLLKASDEGYTLEIRDGGAGWAEQAARRMFNTLGIDYRAGLTADTIRKSWTDASPVKFFPIHRDEYPQQNNGQDLLAAERILTVDDYHPFLHVATVVEQIFEEAGYEIESAFMQQPEFRELYMSGAYPSHDTTGMQARMGFYARRLAAVTATASPAGRVYADPTATAHTVGNIVETATPQTLDADGEAIPELSNNGGTFEVKDRMIRFVPPVQVRAGFEYYLKYTTDHRIASRTRLTGFDSVYLGPGTTLRFTLANRYEDRRGTMQANHTYLAVVFDHAAGDQYRLTCTQDGVSGVAWTTFGARTASSPAPSGESGAVGAARRNLASLHGRLGPLRRLHRGDGAHDGGAAGADGDGGGVAGESEILLCHPLLRCRSGHGADPAQRVLAAPPLPVGAGLRLVAALCGRGAAPHSPNRGAESAGPPLQPALLHGGGDAQSAHRTGGRLLRGGAGGGLAVEVRPDAAGGAGRPGAGSA